MSQTSPMRELPSLKRNVKLDIKTWNALRNMKKANETFNEVILSLLKQRTQAMGGDNLKAIKYHRKVLFLEGEYNRKPIGIEFEYNDIKNELSHFTLDLQIKKVFYGQKSMNPSTFFGVDYTHKHFNHIYLILYLNCVKRVLHKEFSVWTGITDDKDIENIVYWKKIYYEHSLSEDSFVNDIEEPLRLSEEEIRNEKIIDNIRKSPSFGILK